MSSLKQAREVLSELNNSSTDFLVDALIVADRELTAAETARDRFHEAWQQANDRGDLYHRRGEIALAILRDDHDGLTYYKLDKIADIIWPARLLDKGNINKDTTSIPTGQMNSMLGREPDFYIAPTWGEKEGYEIISTALNIVTVFHDVTLRAGFKNGDMFDGMLKSWLDRAKKFIGKFEGNADTP